MNVYIVSYMNQDLYTSYDVYTHKLKAINKFHEMVDMENKEFEEAGIEDRFYKEVTPEDNVYTAMLEGEHRAAKIELRVERIKA